MSINLTVLNIKNMFNTNAVNFVSFCTLKCTRFYKLSLVFLEDFYWLCFFKQPIIHKISQIRVLSDLTDNDKLLGRDRKTKSISRN